MRIGFAGTPEFAKHALEALLRTQHEIVVVYTQPDRPVGRGQHIQPSPVKILAQAHSIPVEQPLHVKDPQAVATLEQYHLDVMIVAAYGLLLPKAFLDIPPKGCINIHASLLPRWRGASPIQQAILAGDKETGITLMRMDVGLDTGNILAQRSCEITNSDTASRLHDKLALLGAQLLIDTLDDIVDKKGQPQDPTLATHAPKITKEQAEIQWDLPAIQIDRQIRAFNPWPVAYTQSQGENLRIWEATVVPGTPKEPPGSIIEQSSQGIIVATGNGALLITQAQLPGKKSLPMTEILKSQHERFAIGQNLN